MEGSFKTFLKFSIGTWINAGISIIGIPIVAWFVVPEEFGKATMFILAYNLLLNIFLLGQDQSFARHFHEVAPELRHRLLTNTLLPSICFTVLGIIPLEVYRSKVAEILFSSVDYAIYVELLSFTIFCGVLSRFALLIIRMQNQALKYSLLQVVLSFTNLVFTIAYAKFIHGDFRAVVVGFASSQIVSLIGAVVLGMSMWHKLTRFEPIRKEITKQLQYGVPFVPTFLLDWVFQSTDRTLLRIYSTFSQIGIYATASRISASLNVLQTGFSTFWTPFVYEKHEIDPQAKTFYPVIFETVYLVFSIAILLVTSSKEIIKLLLPANYEYSIDIFPLLLFVPMLYTLSEITGIGINLKKKTAYHFYIILSCALVSVILGLLLIRLYGAKGAVITNFASYCCFFLLRSVVGARLYRLPLDWRKFGVTFVCTLLPITYSYLSPLSSVYKLIVASLAIISLFHIRTIKMIVRKTVIKR